MSGPRLPLLNLIAAVVTCTVIVGRRDWVFDWRSMYRELEIIARVSVVWFIPVFVARPLNEIFHNPVTRWLVKNRRYLGLSFAAWFLQHLWILPVLGMRPFKVFWSVGQLVFPATTLLVCAILCLTSFDRFQRSLPGWRTLHWLGLQALWLWFLAMYVKLVSRRDEPIYEVIYISLFVAAQALRVGVAIRKLLDRRAEVKADG